MWKCLDSSPWSKTMSSYIRTPEYDNSGITICQLYQDVQAFLVALDMFEGLRGVPWLQRECPIYSNLSLVSANLRCSLSLSLSFFLVAFAVHWNESAMDLHVFPILNPLPPPSPSYPSGSSQCTSPAHLSHASNLDWWSVSHLII